jgi:hypothetical protein
MFEQHLQHAAEQLARALGRSVIIDDAALRPVAVSPQTGLLDPSRVEAVLQRRTSAPLRRRLAEHGIFTAREPVIIPGDASQAVLPRMCFPLADGGRLLGFLWLIDEPALTTGQALVARAAARQAAQLLAQRAAWTADQFAVGSDLADGLLSADPAVRQRAADVLTEQAALPGPPYAVAVLRPLPPVSDRSAAALADRSQAADLRQAAADLRLRLAPGLAVLSSPADGELIAVTAESQLAELRRAAATAPGPPLAAGARGGVAELTGVHMALPDARYAARIAAIVPDLGRYADWSALGAYAVFQHFSRDRAGLERICPGVSALLADRARLYRDAARAYLDCGASAQQAAAQLHLHRTTLYWRLDRAVALTGLDLSRGEDRLRLHLALRLAGLIAQP